jgi:Fe-Mn family superoxide dismutase
MPYTVPPLSYAFDALEPHIDAKTMEIHHDKHHQAYVDKLNDALAGTELDGKPIEEILGDLSQVPEDKRTAVRNNGGGHYNHGLFWESMSADGGGEPEAELKTAIDETFGSFGDFQAKMKAAGIGQFGSGWAWLVHDGSGLAVVSTPNQDNPISSGQAPLLGVDVWEHAYYLLYQNRRPDYLDAWWGTVDWSVVGQRLASLG